MDLKAVIIVCSSCLYFVFDVCCSSSPFEPIVIRKNSNPGAVYTRYDVVSTRSKLLGNNWLSTIRKITICCQNGNCRRVLQPYGETCEPSANFTIVRNEIRRPIPSTDKSSKKPKNRAPGRVTAAGFHGDKAAEIRYRVLSRSNFFRHKYGVPSLAMDEKMNYIAQDWANRLAITGERRHRPSNPYGENIYFTTELDDLGEKAVDSWFKEIVQFNQGDDESRMFSNSATHHMTQLLWKSSSKLGVGVSKNPNNMYTYIVVANYNPPGNVYGQFKRNLPKMT